ncbi:hypothetical protein BTJ68_03311 [Hortaea werneckii EXF-2000]|uniref:Uncharacterized protein n=1 Tax=Hortaea werneckii EXF-2000 TaxID=1157616 RepID=A0A1Z5TKZ9_HORWE|nr:hypothetical protein BTJ68_03311 [Hortaea werneckii EXF-2000]
MFYCGRAPVFLRTMSPFDTYLLALNDVINIKMMMTFKIPLANARRTNLNALPVSVTKPCLSTSMLIGKLWNTPKKYELSVTDVLVHSTPRRKCNTSGG